MPAQPDEIWDRIRGELRRETPDFKFHIWLDPLELVAVQGHVLYVRAPEHVRTWVAERYLPLLRRAAGRGHGRDAAVEILRAAPPPPESASPQSARGGVTTQGGRRRW